MRRIAELGVRFSNFHTTALCSPTRASLLTGRNATTNGMATIAEFSVGLPGHLDAHPVRERVHLRGAGRAGLQHLLRRQVAPHPRRGVQHGRLQGPLAARARASSASTAGSAARRTRGTRTSSTTTTRSSRRARPEDGYHLADDLSDKAIEFIRDAKVIDPDKPFFMYLAPAGRARAAPRAARSGPTGTRARFDQGYEAIRAGHPRAPDRARACCPRAPSCRRSTRTASPSATGPDGQPWPLLDTVRPWDSLSDDEQRLFARMAEVFAGYISYYDDQLGRVLDYLEESGQLDNTLIVVDLRQRRQRRGRPERQRSTSGGSSTAWPTRPSSTLPHIDELGTPAVVQPLQHRLGLGVRHAVPVLEALGGLRGRRRRHVPRRLAGEDPGVEPRSASSTSTPSTSSRPIYELLGIEPPDGDQGLPAEPDRGRELRRGAHRPDASRARRRSSTRCSGQRSIYHEGWLACTVHPPLSGWGKFEQDEWELYDLEHDRSQSTNLAARGTRAARDAEGPVVLLRRASTTGCRSTTAPRSSRCSPSDHAAAPTRTATSYYPDCADVPESAGVAISGRSYTIAAGVERRLGRRRRRALRRTAACAGGHSLYVKDRRLRYTFNWIGTTLQDVVADREHHAGRARAAPPSSPPPGPSTDPAMPGTTGTLTLYVDDAGGRLGRHRHPARVLLPRRRRHLRRTRQRLSRSRPNYAAPFPFTGGTIDKVVVDVSGERYVDHEAQVRGLVHASTDRHARRGHGGESRATAMSKP